MSRELVSRARLAAGYLLVPALLLVLFSGPGLAQQPAPAEKVAVPNEQYQTPEQRARIAQRLDDPHRDVRQKPDLLIAELGIKPGDRVADVGTGTGFMLPHLSRAVGPSGIVYAEDIFPDFLQRARDKAASLKLENVRFILGDERNPKLPQGELDLVVILDAYHHFEYPRTMMDNIRASLKATGRVAIIDFFKRGDMADHVRLDKDGVIAEVQNMGWKLNGNSDALETQFIVIFRRPPQ